MKIGGLQKTTLIDYPGKIAATVFLIGCNFRCPFCYNRELVLPGEIKKQPKIPEKDFFYFLKERKNLLEGVCLSMAGDEPVIIRNSKTLQYFPIEKLWDEENPINSRINPIPHEYQKTNFECLTKDGFRKTKEIIRHKTNELYKIIASPGNYNVKLTGGHSIFVLTKKGLRVKKVSELKKREFLLTANDGLIHNSQLLKSIDLVTYLPQVLNQKEWIISKTFIRHKFSIKKTRIPRRISINKNFCEFLGYAVAEGSSRRRAKKGNLSGYDFSLGNEPRLAQKILKLYRNIFRTKSGSVRTTINNSGNFQYQVIVGNRLIAELINKLVGKGFLEKHIPTLIFNTTSENKTAFLNALTEGDGHQRTREKKSQQEFSIKTSSPRLAADIIFLVSSLGIFSWIEEIKGDKRREKSFRVNISSNDFDKIGVKKKINTKYSFNTRVKGIPKVLIDYALRGQKRIDVERLKKWIDLSDISKEKKRAGIRFGFLTKEGKITERTKIIQFLWKLIQKWDIKEIKSIKKIKLREPQYVYDLVVPKNHSFIGGTGLFLLHNSGGEPTINKDLPQFIRKIKKLGYLVKLDTNGSNSKMLKELIDKKLIDYVAMDAKAPKEKYIKMVGKKINVENIEKSIKILKENKVDNEFRTTVVPTLLDKNDILKIAHWIKPAKKYFLQNFRPEKTIDPNFEEIKPYPQEYLLEIRNAIAPLFEICQIR